MSFKSPPSDPTKLFRIDGAKWQPAQKVPLRVSASMNSLVSRAKIELTFSQIKLGRL
jgi:hypothetical protein